MPGMPAMPSLPGLPTMPAPLFGDITVPAFSTPHWIIELQNLQYGAVSITILTTIANILGVSLSSLLPPIPGLGSVTIMDFLNGQYDKIKTAILNAGTAFTSLFPSPLFGTISAPTIEIAHMMQLTFSMCIVSLTEVIMSKISAVLSILPPGLPSVTIPTMPSLATIRLQLGLGNLSFPGFPTITLPNYGNVHMPSMAIEKDIPMVVEGMLLAMVQPLVGWINSLASTIGAVTWPKLCVTPTGYYVG
jgi:hypothetical protein